MEETLFDVLGFPVAYIAYDEESTIYLWNGTPVAYLFEDTIYGFNGKHLGWYYIGKVWNLQGLIVGFNREASDVFTRYEPYKSYKKYRPYRCYRCFLRRKPIWRNIKANVSLREFLEDGRR